MHLVRGEPGYDNHLVGPVRMAARQSRVVAPDLGTGSLGMREKVEVVNGHDLSRPASRHEERVQRVCDVGVPARQRFGRRPSQSVPGEVQELHGDMPIDQMSARQVGVVFQPVPGRAREERQIDGRGGLPLTPEPEQ